MHSDGVEPTELTWSIIPEKWREKAILRLFLDVSGSKMSDDIKTCSPIFL